MNQKIVQYLTGWLVLAIFSVSLFPHPESALQSDIPRLGMIASRSYVAPITFELPKPKAQLEKEQEQASEKVDAYFEFNVDASNRILREFHSAMDQIARVGILKARLSQSPQSKASVQPELDELQQKLNLRLSATAIHYLSMHQTARDTLRKTFDKIILNGVSDVLLASTPRQLQLYQEYHNLRETAHLLYSKSTITLIRDNKEVSREVSTVRPKEAVIEDAFTSLQSTAMSSQGLQSAYYEALHAFVEPNLFYLEKETRDKKAESASLINTNKGMVFKGMEIIAPGTIVTQEAVEKLEALQNALTQEQGKQSLLTTGLGQALFMLLTSSLFVLGALMLRKGLFSKIQHYWGFITIQLLQVVSFFLTDMLGQDLLEKTSFFPEGSDAIWLQPFVLAPVLATVLFSFKVGILSGLFSAIHLGMQSGYDLATTMASFSVILATIFFLRHIRYRSHFLVASLSGTLMLVFSILLTLLLRNRLGWHDFWPGLLLGSLQILSTLAIASFFLIHLLEGFFGITTNLTLMELSDFNHPALKRLSEKAPGSFHHSIMVGNLAEKAALRIGANPLLTRVICLYHDIGKSENPSFYTENQKRGENPHDNLEPSESARIIRSHVTDGLLLAAQYKLPAIIASGIPEHHGTNIIHYFFRKALTKYPDQEIPVEDYRYPGPAPQSKETALVMLADSIEATSRSMEDPDPAKLAKLVQDVIQTRLQENQLLNSGLSILELEDIEIGFLQSLEGMYHTRIQYPEGVFISTRSRGQADNGPQHR